MGSFMWTHYSPVDAMQFGIMNRLSLVISKPLKNFWMNSICDIPKSAGKFYTSMNLENLSRATVLCLNQIDFQPRTARNNLRQ